jgi:hypothetical protein
MKRRDRYRVVMGDVTLGDHSLLMKRSHWQIKAPTYKPLLKSKLGLGGA